MSESLTPQERASIILGAFGRPGQHYRQVQHDFIVKHITEAAEADRTTWQQRATSAEKRVEELRGEVTTLRQFVEEVAAARPDADYTFCYDAQEVLTATPRATKLGALIDAALAVATTKHVRIVAEHWGDTNPSKAELALAQETVKTFRAAADAVLAATPTPPATVGETAAGEEGT